MTETLNAEDRLTPGTPEDVASLPELRMGYVKRLNEIVLADNRDKAWTVTDRVILSMCNYLYENGQILNPWSFTDIEELAGNLNGVIVDMNGRRYVLQLRLVGALPRGKGD